MARINNFHEKNQQTYRISLAIYPNFTILDFISEIKQCIRKTSEDGSS
jgi:hypothetical protein